MSTGAHIDGGYRSFETADTTITSRGLRVKLSGDRTVTVAGVDAEDDIGVADYREATASRQIAVKLFGAGTLPMVASAAIAQNALVYPAASGKISSTAAGAPIGRALEAASGDGSIIEVLPFVKDRGPRKITDPGNGGAIPVTHSGVCSLTSGGSNQTRSVAAPTFDGQDLMLAFDVDGGGDIVVTVAAAINQTGNNTITFDTAGENLSLKARRQAGALKWAIQVNDGGALSTV